MKAYHIDRFGSVGGIVRRSSEIRGPGWIAARRRAAVILRVTRPCADRASTFPLFPAGRPASRAPWPRQSYARVGPRSVADRLAGLIDPIEMGASDRLGAERARVAGIFA